MSEPAVQRDHTGGVLGIALGLGVLIGSLWFLLQQGLFALVNAGCHGSAGTPELDLAQAWFSAGLFPAC